MTSNRMYIFNKKKNRIMNFQEERELYKYVNGSKIMNRTFRDEPIA